MLHEHGGRPNNLDTNIAQSALHELMALEQPHQSLAKWDDESATLLQSSGELDTGLVRNSDSADSAVVLDAPDIGLFQASPIVMDIEDSLNLDDLNHLELGGTWAMLHQIILYS